MIQLLAGDCRDVLATLPAESVQCCVTSPPYYGLRSYGVGAEHGEIGSEPTPDEYLATMVAVFREVRRVLRKDGTVWCNIGDSYASTNGKTSGGSDFSRWKGGQTLNDRDPANERQTGLKPKDLLMMPARLALALQADGWWVRSDIIWHKPNPMPESCTDRPTSAHEHVFLLTRSAKYFYDNEAIREPGVTTAEEWETKAANWRNGTAKQQSRGSTYHPFKDAKPFESGPNPAGRSCRNVWTIPTSPFSAAHFATFPPALAERCIRAGTSERGACSQCGKPWVRETSTEFVKLADRRPTRKAVQDGANMTDINSHNVMGYNDVTTTGWAPGCACNAEVRPCVVLDCFAGAGTTLLCADRLQRDAIGIELNPSYTEMAMQRCRDDAPLFTAFPPAEDPETERMADLFADAAE